MSSSAQMLLEFPEAYLAEEKWPKVLELVRQVAVDVGRKTVCDELDISRSVLDNVLLDRDRHALKARHLIYFILKDDSGRIIELLAGICGKKVERKREPTPEEKVRAYERAIRRQLGEVGDRILSEALAEVG